MGNYRLVRLIAEGGMGQVYEVKHIELGRRAALKVLRPDIAQNEEMCARFFTEARAMSILQHPALIHVYEYGHLDDGGAFIVMEYVEGDTLRELLEQYEGKLPTITALQLVRQMAAALQAAHGKGIVHRDLKPENIKVVTAEEGSVESRIKILDFGIAKIVDVETDVNAIKTRPGQMLGTPTYMAPEQAVGQGGIGAHTDVYALGVILFEALSGRPPFTAEDAIQIVSQHLFSEPPRLKDIDPDANLDLDALLNRMLTKAPEARPTMREVKDQLGKISRQVEDRIRQAAVEVEDSSQAETFIMRGAATDTTPFPVSKIVIPKRIRRRRALLFAAAGLIIFSLLAVGAWLVLSSPPNQATPAAPRAKDEADAAAQLPKKEPKPGKDAADGKEPSDPRSSPSEDADSANKTKRRPPRPNVRVRATGAPPTSPKPPEEKPSAPSAPRLVD